MVPAGEAHSHPGMIGILAEFFDFSSELFVKLSASVCIILTPSEVKSLSHVWLCNPRDCSTPGFPVHRQLPELAQTPVHWVCDAIQLSHPLSTPSPLAFNLSQHQSLFNESVLCIRWPKYCSFSVSISPSNEYSGPIAFRIAWLDCLAVQGAL